MNINRCVCCGVIIPEGRQVCHICENMSYSVTETRQIADLYLELEDLIECDMKTGKIKVDKQIFDDFVPNTYINIQFVDTDSNEVLSYAMVAEDDEGIYMEYMGE